MVRLQEDLNNDPEYQTIQSIAYWAANKRDRLDVELVSLNRLDSENYVTGSLLDESEANVREAYKENSELKEMMRRDFKEALGNRKGEWLRSLKEKMEVVEAAKREERERREREFNELEEQVSERSELVKTSKIYFVEKQNKVVWKQKYCCWVV